MTNNSNFTITYTSPSITGKRLQLFSNTIVGAPSKEDAIKMFKTIMCMDITHIIDISIPVSPDEFVSPVRYREILSV